MASENTDNRGVPQNAANEQFPWYFRTLQKAGCILAGIICALLGVFTCISFSGLCILGGILQVLTGLIVLMCEAPCCCQFIDFIDHIDKFSQSRPPWQKAILYCGLPIGGVAICQKITAIFGFLFIFLCGLSFAFMALGKKATREQQLAAARENQYRPLHDRSEVVDSPQPTAQVHSTPSQIV